MRKALVRSKLAECQANLPRSDSMDSMLGDSLLDPPQSLQKIPPKRYQSPSRCGSPSLETPEHLLFGKKRYSPPRSPTQERRARQDLLRRRDMTLFYGLHPRLLHSGAEPKLSLPLAQLESSSRKSANQTRKQVPLGQQGANQVPCRPKRRLMTSDEEDCFDPVDDRMQVRKLLVCHILSVYHVWLFSCAAQFLENTFAHWRKMRIISTRSRDPESKLAMI